MDCLDIKSFAPKTMTESEPPSPSGRALQSQRLSPPSIASPTNGTTANGGLIRQSNTTEVTNTIIITHTIPFDIME